MCWNVYCVLVDCDGVNHEDETRMTWFQYESQRYCPACGEYVYMGECAHDDFED